MMIRQSVRQRGRAKAERNWTFTPQAIVRDDLYCEWSVHVATLLSIVRDDAYFDESHVLGVEEGLRWPEVGRPSVDLRRDVI